MSDFFTVKHSYNSGDLITILPGMQKLFWETGKKSKIYQRKNLPAYYYDGAVSSVNDKDGQSVSMNDEMFDKLKPLIECQEYIESFEEWKGEKVDFDIDLTRGDKFVPMPAGEIHSYAWSLYPELSCDLSQRWIKIVSDYGGYYATNFLLVNRTQRYQNPYITYYFLKKYIGKIKFVGTETEHQSFCEMNNFTADELPRLVVKDFKELADHIYLSRCFLGNQSMAWHIADGLKVNRVLELCPQFPNTFPSGANGHAFYRQAALEYYVEKMMA